VHLTYRGLITFLWIAWLLYWLLSALNAKTTQRRESIVSRLTYVVPMLAGAWLIGAPRTRLGWLSTPLLPEQLWRLPLAVVLVALGLGFTVWARVHLGRNWSGSVTLKEGHELIRSGPYAYVRHPIYTGLIVALIGSTLACGEPRALLGLALMLFSFVYKLRIEEGFMRTMFPGQYERYSEAVPALVPFTAARRSAPH
jgi:Isoprenylcysteine carboxyl methyltransferase (ICMT) family